MWDEPGLGTLLRQWLGMGIFGVLEPFASLGVPANIPDVEFSHSKWNFLEDFLLVGGPWPLMELHSPGTGRAESGPK